MRCGGLRGGGVEATVGGGWWWGVLYIREVVCPVDLSRLFVILNPSGVPICFTRLALVRS